MYQLTITFQGSAPQRHHVIEDPTRAIMRRGFAPVFGRTSYLHRAADGAVASISRVRPWDTLEDIFSLRYPEDSYERTRTMKTINSDTIVYVLTAIGRHDEAQRDIQNMPIDCVYEDGRRVFLDSQDAYAARRRHEGTDDLDATYHVSMVEAEDVPDHILEISGYRIS